MGCNPLFITSLNSGSNGNCYYVGNAQEAVLIDAGISCRETEKEYSLVYLGVKAIQPERNLSVARLPAKKDGSGISSGTISTAIIYQRFSKFFLQYPVIA